MSPAAPRRYFVAFCDYALFETVVLAASKREAVAKVKAIYALNNVGHFDASITSLKLKDLSVTRIREEVRS
jgi:hypothetical protein